MARALALQPLGRVAADDEQTSLRHPAADGGEHLVEQLADAVEVRPPLEAAEEEQRGRLARPAARLEVVRVHAVIDDLDPRHAEVVTEALAVEVADRDGEVGVLKGVALEADELPPLLADVPALQGVTLGLM